MSSLMGQCLPSQQLYISNPFQDVEMLRLNSLSRIIILNKMFSILRLVLLENVLLSSLIRVVYDSLRRGIANEVNFCWTDSFSFSP